jgi:hypothetical protein
VDGDQNGAEDQEVAQAGQVEQMRPAAGESPAGHDGGGDGTGRDAAVQRGHPGAGQEGQPGEKLQISSVIGCSFVVLCSARCR